MDVSVKKSGYYGLGVSLGFASGRREKIITDRIPIVTVANNIQKVGGGKSDKNVAMLNSCLATR